MTCQRSCLSSIGSPATEHKPKTVQLLIESKGNVLFSSRRGLEVGTELHMLCCVTTLQTPSPFTFTTCPWGRSYHPHFTDAKSDLIITYLKSTVCQRQAEIGSDMAEFQAYGLRYPIHVPTHSIFYFYLTLSPFTCFF